MQCDRRLFNNGTLPNYKHTAYPICRSLGVSSCVQVWQVPFFTKSVHTLQGKRRWSLSEHLVKWLSNAGVHRRRGV